MENNRRGLIDFEALRWMVKNKGLVNMASYRNMPGPAECRYKVDGFNPTVQMRCKKSIIQQS